MSALSPTQQSIDTQRQWLISVGFKHNVSADFKAWIMYNEEDTYGPDGDDAISTANLKEFKQLHNYEELKDSTDTEWYNFLDNK